MKIIFFIIIITILVIVVNYTVSSFDDNNKIFKKSYMFVHPTKCGGTSFVKYINKNQLDIGIGGHDCICSKYPNPIIFLRDPLERFLSMYNYWKNGSIDLSIHTRGQEFINYSID